MRPPRALEVIEDFFDDYLCSFSDGEVTSTLINDLLWFEVDDILELNGFDPNTYEKKAQYE